MKLNRFTAFGMIIITFWTSLAIASVGNISECDPTPTAWHFPISMFFVFLVPFLAGYFGGKVNE